MRSNRRLEVFHFEIFIHVLIEARFLILIAHADQQAFAFAVEIKRLRKVDHERKIFGDFLQRIRREHLPADGNDRDLDSCHLTDLTCPGSGRVQDQCGSGSRPELFPLLRPDLH